MKKLSKKTLCFLFALIFVMQFALPVASAAGDTSVPDKAETLPAISYNLNVQLTPEQYNQHFKPEGEADAKENKIIEIPAEKESLVFPEALQCTVSFSATADEKAQSLTRTPAQDIKPVLDGRSIDIFVPDGYYVSKLTLDGKDLLKHSTATLNAPYISIDSSVLTVKETVNNVETLKFNTEFIPENADALVLDIELSILPEGEKVVNVDGTEVVASADGSYALEAPEAPENKIFDGWKVTFPNGSSLTVSPDTVSVTPYTSCTITPVFADAVYNIEISVKSGLTMTENDEFPADFYDVAAPKGFTVEGVDKLITAPDTNLAAETPLKEGNYNVSLVLDNMVVKNVGTTLSAQNLNVTQIDGTINVTAAQGNGNENQGGTGGENKPVEPETPTPPPAPETPETPTVPAQPVEVILKANAPTVNADKSAVESNGYMIVGELKDGDVIKDGSVTLTAARQSENSSDWYISITGGEIVNADGSAVDAGKYNLKLQNSETVSLPIPLTIKANTPKLNAENKYVEDGFTATGLVDGDTVKKDSVIVELVTEKNGDVYAQVKAAKGGIKIENNGSAVADGKYASPVLTPSDSVKPVVPSEPTRGELKLKPKDVSAVYDGKEHAASEYEIVSGTLAEGDTVEVKYSGSAENYTAKAVESTLSSVVIKDKDGKTVTDKYTIELVPGSISISKRPITFTAATLSVGVGKEDTLVKASKLPDAQGYSGGYKIEEGSADQGLIVGHKVKSITVNGEGRYSELKNNDKSFETSIDASSIKISNGSADVTDNYDIKTVNGKIKLSFTGKDTPKEIPVTVTAKSGKWTYDGNAHELKEIESVTGLVDGDQIKSASFKNTSTITNAGSVKNEIASVIITDKNGNAVPVGKYKVSYTDGTLTVDKYNLTVTAESASKVYDGKPLENKNVSVGKLANSGHTIQVEYTIFTSKNKALQNPPIDPGTYAKKITKVVILDSSKNDVTENYKVNKVDGTLTIKSGDKNNSTGPKTGDESNIGLWIGILAVSAVVIAAVVIVIVVKNKKNSQNGSSDNELNSSNDSNDNQEDSDSKE